MTRCSRASREISSVPSAAEQMSSEVPEQKLSACCLSHEFHKAVSKCPDKIAVIHATGFAQTVRDLRRNYNADQPPFHDTCKIDSAGTGPPVYTGDECFTFSDILSAVECLSCRIKHILNGASNRCLGEPLQIDIFGQKSESISGASSHSSLSMLQSTIFIHTPKIIAIYMEPSMEYIVSVLSILRCGEAFMPLDPSWPKSRILSLLASSQADLVIGYKFSAVENSCHKLDMLQWLIEDGVYPVLPFSMKQSSQEQVCSSQFEWPCESGNSRSFCYLMHTSGSSGKPKSVCGTEIGLLNRFLWMQELYPLHDGDLVLFKTPISFIDHLQEFLGPLLSTCTLVIPPSNQLKENIFYIIDFLQGYLISRLVAVPSLIRAILPGLHTTLLATIQNSLKLLVLSGEILQLSFCQMLVKLLPHSSILNLYGSTEVTGDCTYFDCKRLSLVLENEALDSVPIGLPLSNCDVVLVGDDAYQGEIVVGGLCVAAGYFQYPHLIPVADMVLPSIQNPMSPSYFRTGDFARKLRSGDLVFLGRKDRTIKLNGQRMALEEIEKTLKEHPNVIDVAVVCGEVEGEIISLEAHVVKKNNNEDDEVMKLSCRAWLQSKLPLAMIPTHIVFTRSLPLTYSGKVDYVSLVTSTHSDHLARINIEVPRDNLIQVIKKVFSDALMVEKVSGEDDFFEMGGNSISAAYVSFKLGIHMKLLYSFPTPCSLEMALSSSSSSVKMDTVADGFTRPEKGMHFSEELKIPPLGSTTRGRLFGTDENEDSYNTAKKLKATSSISIDRKTQSSTDSSWDHLIVHKKCSFSRCNKSMHGGQCADNCVPDTDRSNIQGNRKSFMQVEWKVHMNSCVDASPLVACEGNDVYLFIGSHSQIFICINAKSGVVLWETKLEGRVECSAAILDDFSQVVVGCYLGYIYFLHFATGSVCWSFQTHGEVKSQPVVDKCRHLVWCGSYDHYLYAIDYKSYQCVYKLQCEGSIFGSPAIDEIQEKLFVASTSGHITALSIKAMPFEKIWKQDLGAPVFGSLLVDCSTGNIICCSVDGIVTVLDTGGSIIWKARTGGPIFAGPCTSGVLPSEVLVCSRDGSIYSFEMETGVLLWKHSVGNPITSSPCVDENTRLISHNSLHLDCHLLLTTHPNHPMFRLICVCESSGNVHVLRVESKVCERSIENRKITVHEFAQLKLGGDVFSSPVMIGGRIFVGCRDDYVYCINLHVE